jgi:putative addiction module component (TIGR02574 family)
MDSDPAEVEYVDLKTIEEEALHLPPEQRAQLAQTLLLSLDSQDEAEVDAAWLAEARRRAAEIDRGEVEPIPAEEVRRKALALLR